MILFETRTAWKEVPPMNENRKLPNVVDSVVVKFQFLFLSGMAEKTWFRLAMAQNLRSLPFSGTHAMLGIMHPQFPVNSINRYIWVCV